MNKVVYVDNMMCEEDVPAGFSVSLKALHKMADLGHAQAKNEYDKILAKNSTEDEPDVGYLQLTNRHDKLLIQVVEELESDADGPGSVLAIKEIAGQHYRIEEYEDGEEVITPDQEVWVEIPL